MKKHLWFLVFMSSLGVGRMAFAVDPFLDEIVVPLSERLTWNWGLSIDTFALGSSRKSQRFSLLNDVVLNASLHFSQDEYFYVSGRNYVQWQPTPPNEKGTKNVSHAYNLQKLHFHTEGVHYKLTLGRDRFTMGSGIIYNNHADGINAEIAYGGFSFQAIGAASYLVTKLKKDFDEFKKTVEELSSGSNRVFAGGKLAYSFLNQNVYAIVLNQWDLKRYTQGNFSNKINTMFLVGGLNVSFWQGFFWDSEFIYQMGRQSTYQATFNERFQLQFNDNRVKIRAFAFDTQLRYYTRMDSQLNFMVQYSLGSGDKHSLVTIEPITKTTAFNAFGQFNSGFVLAPALKNLHIVRTEVAGNPLFFVDALLSKFYSSIQYAMYMKHVKEGFMSDPDADRPKALVGHAIELFMIWKAMGGVSLFTQGGVLLKGPAYRDKKMMFKVIGGVQLAF